MKTTKKIICTILTVFILMNMFTFFSFAASPKVVVSISSDRTSQTAGKTIMLTVNIDVKNGDGLTIEEMNRLKINFNTSLFELESVAPLVDSNGLSISKSNPVTINFKREGEENFNGDIATITLRIKNTADVGETSFAFSVSSFLDKNRKSISYSCDSPYTDFVISDKASSNNLLSNLVANEGKLSPNFNKNTTKYTMTVPNNVKRVNLQYATEDTAATAKISGASNLKVGENEVKITVTAENGTTKVYKITVTREAKSASNDTSSIIPPVDDSMSKETYEKELQKAKNRNLIINLVLIFIILAEAAYIIIDKVSKRKPAPKAVIPDSVAAAINESSGEDFDDDEGEPQNIIDSILNNTDDDLE